MGIERIAPPIHSGALIRSISGIVALLFAEGLFAADATLAGCKVFPANNVWNAAIDTLPVHPSSGAYVQTIGAASPVHADFGSGTFDGGPVGIPFVVVAGNQPRVPIQFVAYNDESDPGPYPVPPEAPVEGGPSSTGDRHVLVLDSGSCKLYELYRAFPAAGGWHADSGAVFDLGLNQLRHLGWTSADAAGFAILPGLVRYDEVAAGEIRHALRFTVPKTRKAYVWPATHDASPSTDTQYPPMGQRFRLRASFDDSGLSMEARVIATALKKYGMMIADNGSAWFISGAPDARWNNDHLRDLRSIKGSDFEAVDQSSLMLDATSGSVRAPLRIVNAASLMEGAVAAAEIVTIFGSGLSGSVKADGADAAILYTSDTQINAILPLSLMGSTTTIDVSGIGGGQMNSPVANENPGIFTIPPGGQGQGAILNQDFSVNGIDGPAGRGTVVQIFATGGGRMTGRTSVQIDGKDAQILYAGNAPVYPGLIQVNAKVPDSSRSGAVPVIVKLGDSSSQAGVTLAVR